MLLSNFFFKKKLLMQLLVHTETCEPKDCDPEVGRDWSRGGFLCPVTLDGAGLRGVILLKRYHGSLGHQVLFRQRWCMRPGWERRQLCWPEVFQEKLVSQ